MSTTSKPKPAAQFVEPEKVTPENRKGSSKVKYPVARTWVLCLNLTAQDGKGEVLARSKYIKAAVELGVAYYTARTQVDKYLRWEANGRQGATPRGVVLES